MPPEEIQELVLPRPFEAHFHPRQREMMRRIIHYTSAVCSRGVPMPNTEPAILTAEAALAWHQEIVGLTRNHDFESLLTIMVTPETTITQLRDAGRAEVVLGKVYPFGMTTNSELGFRAEDYLSRGDELFPAMREFGMILSLHGEYPGAPMLESERRFLELLHHIVIKCPDLRIILEHVSTVNGVEFVKQMPPNVAATITAHHPFLTTDDALRSPHNFCKPVAQSEADRQALIAAAISGNPQFFFGSDSAPHPRHLKECAKPKAGVFTAPVAIQLIVQLFEEHHALDQLPAFLCRHAEAFYGLPPTEGTIRLVRKPMVVPSYFGVDVVPLMADQELPWSFPIV